MANICIRGARTHNLKNIDIELPRDQLIVVTGLSGSGKSSLVFDTLYAEGQRRYVESLSAYARQFLSVMDKPDVDHIEGLSPAIAIQQKSSSHNPRSTVGTVTEIYDYLRVLLARVGEARCPKHGVSLAAQTISQMTDSLLALPIDTRVMLMAPVVRGQKGEHAQILEQLRRQGYIRVRIDGQLTELDSMPCLNRRQKHAIDVVVDRLKLRPDIRLRLAESLAAAIQLSDGLVTIVMMGESSKEQVFSARFACPQCGYSLSELEPRLFSFNSPKGACPSCAGLGVQSGLDAEGRDPKDSYLRGRQVCPTCVGTRLRPEAHFVFLKGHSLPELTSWSIDRLHQFFSQLSLPGQKGVIASGLRQEIQNRLGFLVNVGLEYLNLARRTDSLSGGEAQRIRLASQIGSGLVGVMYVLDEPSIGLHPRDNARLLSTLHRLRDLGNTVIVVEHDEEAIRQADYVVDIGPGAGVQGGQVVAQGPPAAILQHPDSLTGHYLSGRRQIKIPPTRYCFDAARVLRLEQASGHNLQQIDIEIPLGLMTCITGVSGSGKSTLINDTLYPIVAKQLNGANREAASYGQILGLEQLDKVIEIDQSPIGRTPRSNPATYSGLLGIVRELFAATPEARSRGYSPGRFSFNVKGGRCEACEGDGVLKVEMHFLADVYVPCELCRGQRYNRETLEILYKGKTISEVLAMSVAEAHTFFSAVPSLTRILQTLVEVGLAYLCIGQNATQLSGGEAQRLKLARELTKRDTGTTLYLLDEPTTGLHFYDIEQLLKLLHRLRNQGNSVVVIEHNLDVIKTADWIIDLGPEGGRQGGKVVCCGTPETVAQNPNSYTGKFLRLALHG